MSSALRASDLNPDQAPQTFSLSAASMPWLPMRAIVELYFASSRLSNDFQSLVRPGEALVLSQHWELSKERVDAPASIRGPENFGKITTRVLAATAEGLVTVDVVQDRSSKGDARTDSVVTNGAPGFRACWNAGFSTTVQRIEGIITVLRSGDPVKIKELDLTTLKLTQRSS